MNNVEPEQESSMYTIIDLAVKVLPDVKGPEVRVPLKKKLMWSAVILVIYFILGEITIYGMSGEAKEYFSFFKAILASESGTLITLGIGPLVASGILMQLFQGVEIFHFDLTSYKGRVRFQGAQRLLAVSLCLIEAAVYVGAGAFGNYSGGREIFLMMQIALGGVLVILLVDTISKWGFGSGVSLFILGGVSKDILWKLFSFQRSTAHDNQFIGAVPSFIESLTGESPVWVRASLPDVSELFFTLVIFLAVVYLETLWMEIPLSSGRFRGIRGGYPIKFIYTSVIPVIFTLSFFRLYEFFARSLASRFGISFLGIFDSSGNPVGGLVYYLSSPNNIIQTMEEPYRSVIYVVAMVVSCAFFAVMWVDMAGMDSKSVAQHIQQESPKIAGLQRDIRVIENALNKYIPQVTVLGGVSVGLLAASADLVGALGSGTGILLAVGISYRMYLDLMRDRTHLDLMRDIE